MDITTTYMGMSLRSPLVASAGPLTGSVDQIRQLEDAGIAAVVLPSLFEEQLSMERRALKLRGVAYVFPGADGVPDRTGGISRPDPACQAGCQSARDRQP